MLTRPKPATVPPAADTKSCQSCGATRALLEDYRLPDTGEVVQRCTDPATCHKRADAAETWCTYTPTT